MHARILAIGDELLLGRTVDSNSTAIARLLTDAGVEVVGVRQVGDALAAIVTALKESCAAAPLVVCCGGLGPTDDDRTRAAVAAVMGVELAPNADAWDGIVAAYARLRPGKIVPETNRRQALLPIGAELLANDRGTAPGVLARAGATWIACVPGVPHEMQAMVERLVPRLPTLLPGLTVPALDEFCFAGLGESDAQERLGDLITERDPQVGITVNELGHITLRTRGTPAQVATRGTALRAALTPWLLPAAGIAPSLIAFCRARGLSIATAESCTAGHAAAQLAAIAGASAVLRAGFVTYQDAAKTAHLGVPADLIAQHGAVSEPVARAMAEGARRIAGTDVAVAITGVAGPGALGAAAPTQSAIPAGTVLAAVADARGTVHRVLRIPGTRERVQKRAAAQALLLLWERVSGRSEAL